MVNTKKIALLTLISASSLTLTLESAEALSFSFNTGVASYAIGGAEVRASGLNLTIPNVAYFANTPVPSGSAWIGPQANAANSGVVGDYFYTTTFNLTGLAPSSATISTLQVASDNLFTAVTLNGSNIFIPITNSTFSGFTNYALDQNTFRNNLSSGSNTLTFTVNNSGGPTAFRSQFAVDVQPVPFEFESATGLMLVGGYFVRKRYLKFRKAS
jgi:hypothetical protein